MLPQRPQRIELLVAKLRPEAHTNLRDLAEPLGTIARRIDLLAGRGNGPTAVKCLQTRSDASVLVAFLGYALQVTLKHRLKRSGSEYSPTKALQRLSQMYSVDIVLWTVEGREIWLRRITKREDDEEKLLNQLHMELPECLEPMQILKCSADSATA